MKTSSATFFSLCLAFATATSALAQGVAWSADSTSAFGITINGTGGFFNQSPTTNSAGWGVSYNNPITSPSGLWSFQGAILGHEEFSGLYNRDGIKIDQSSSGITYNPNSKSLVFSSYGDNVPFSNPRADNTSYNPNTGPFGYWHGSFGINFTSIPDQNQPQTWSWVITINGSGPDLTPAPEPSVGNLFVLGILGIALLSQLKSHQPSRDRQTGAG